MAVPSTVQSVRLSWCIARNAIHFERTPSSQALFLSGAALQQPVKSQQAQKTRSNPSHPPRHHGAPKSNLHTHSHPSPVASDGCARRPSGVSSDALAASGPPRDTVDTPVSAHVPVLTHQQHPKLAASHTPQMRLCASLRNRIRNSIRGSRMHRWIACGNRTTAHTCRSLTQQ